MTENDWRDRASPHDSPFSWSPRRSDLAFAVLRNGPVETDALTLALFNPNIAVDAMGNVLTLDSGDFDHLVSLANLIPDLPPTNIPWNTWAIKQPITSQPIDRLLLPLDDDTYMEISVQGYDSVGRELKEPVAVFPTLPDVIHELFELIAYSRVDYDRNSRDDETLEAVLQAVGYA
jgi:hypothetical protein